MSDWSPVPRGTEEEARERAEAQGLKRFTDPGPCRYLCPGCGKNELTRDAEGYSTGRYTSIFNTDVCADCIARIKADHSNPFSFQHFMWKG